MKSRANVFAGVITPETAAAPPSAEQAGELIPRSEAYAVMEHEVASQTATLNAQITDLTTEHAAAIEAAEARLAAETARADAAVQALADFKAEIAQAELVATQTASRRAAIEALEGLPDGFVTDERASRWGGQTEEAWAETLADLTEIFGAKSAGAGAGKSAETAKFSRTVPLKSDDEGKKTTSAGRAYLASLTNRKGA